MQMQMLVTSASTFLGAGGHVAAGAIAGAVAGGGAPGMVREVLRGFTFMARSGSGASPIAGNIPRLSRPVSAVIGASLGAATIFMIKDSNAASDSAGRISAEGTRHHG